MKAPKGLSRHQRRAGRFWRKWRLPVALTGFLLVALASANYLHTQHREIAKAELATALKQAATDGAVALAARLQAQIEILLRPLDLEALARLASGEDRNAALAKGAEIARNQPLILAARLLPKGYSTTDYEAKPPFSFASLDMLRRAEAKGQAPDVEVHFLGNDELQHVAVLRPLKQDKTLVGHLFLFLDVKLLKALTKGLPAKDVYAELSQPLGRSAPIVLGRTGNKRARQGPPAASLVVPGSAWRISVWPIESHPAHYGLDLPLLPMAGGLGAIALLALGLVLRRRRKRVTSGEDESLQPARETPTVSVASTVAPAPDAAGALPLAEAAQAPSPAEALPPKSGAMDTEGDTIAQTRSATTIFRPCEIRGLVGENLDRHIVFELARAVGSEAYDRDQQTFVVASDCRESSAELMQAVSEGLRATGRDVIEIGVAPTPVLYYAAQFLNTQSAVMVTGSNGPMEENGLVVLIGGEILVQEDFAALEARLSADQLHSGEGTVRKVEMTDEYIRRISEEIPIALGNSYRIVADCANGAASLVAPKLIQALGHEVIELHCDVDVDCPYDAPDPNDPENLRDICAAVALSGADLGFAFDGDGTRLVVVDAEGKPVGGDRILMLLAADVLGRRPGAQIIFDAKCSGRLAQVIKAKGGKAVLCRTGHAHIKRRLKELESPLAGGKSGRYYFGERWYGFEDGLYTAARLLEVLMALKRTPTEVFAKLPQVSGGPEYYIPMSDEDAGSLIAKLRKAQALAEGRITTVDGVRVDFERGFGLVRACGSRPGLTITLAGNDDSARTDVSQRFSAALSQVAPGLELPF